MLDETGGFEVVVPGVTAGDRAVVRVVLGGQQSEPALLTVPSQAPPSRPVRRP